MKIYKDGIEGFSAWSGAIATWDAIQEYDKVNELETILDEIYPEGMSETDLNDLLWFEPETVCEWVGLYYNEGDITGEETEEEDY
jgi:hypothetical protein